MTNTNMSLVPKKILITFKSILVFNFFAFNIKVKYYAQCNIHISISKKCY